MGTFTDSRPESVERRRSNHKRTAYFVVMVETKCIETIKSRVVDAADTINIEWVDESGGADGMSELIVGYGPAYDSFRSDIEKLFERWEVEIFDDLEFLRAEHADDCDHHSHRS